MHPGNIDSVPQPVDIEGDLFARMTAAAHAEFTLTAAANGIEISGRDMDLVNVAVVAGVVGALTVLREDDEGPPGSTRH